jgi:hypothetical protein
VIDAPLPFLLYRSSRAKPVLPRLRRTDRITRGIGNRYDCSAAISLFAFEQLLG